jgi:putative oxidoreductase
MERILGRYTEYIYAIVRIIMGLFFVLHATQKFWGYPPLPAGMQGGPPTGMLLVAGVIELVCGLLILFGFFASIAAFIASGEMAVAYFIGHFPHGFWPHTNVGEPAVLYCFIFLYIAAKGSGVWSIDSLRGAPAARLGG